MACRIVLILSHIAPSKWFYHCQLLNALRRDRTTTEPPCYSNDMKHTALLSGGGLLKPPYLELRVSAICASLACIHRRWLGMGRDGEGKGEGSCFCLARL